MNGVHELSAWRSGKKTRRGLPVHVEPEVVTVIERRVAGRFFGTRDRGELQAHLRRLRHEGRLIHEPGRLQQKVRVDAPGARHGIRRERAYVVRGRCEDIPRRRRARARVFLA